MGKQTMATPMHTWHLNSETKMYRLQNPNSPFFRPAHYDYINMDEFPMGTNAIVAVSYTGYDMEDAMIINKMSFERGFGAGSIYKSSFIDLKLIAGGRKDSNVYTQKIKKKENKGREFNVFFSFKDTQTGDLIFERDPSKAFLSKHLDEDGLPHPGVPMTEGDPLYCYLNRAEGTYSVKHFEGNPFLSGYYLAEFRFEINVTNQYIVIYFQARRCASWTQSSCAATTVGPGAKIGPVSVSGFLEIPQSATNSHHEQDKKASGKKRLIFYGQSNVGNGNNIILKFNVCRYLLPEMAGGGSALDGERYVPGYPVQPSRLPHAYDHRHDDRVYGGQIRRSEWPLPRRYPLHLR